MMSVYHPWATCQKVPVMLLGEVYLFSYLTAAHEIFVMCVIFIVILRGLMNVSARINDGWSGWIRYHPHLQIYSSYLSWMVIHCLRFEPWVFHSYCIVLCRLKETFCQLISIFSLAVIYITIIYIYIYIHIYIYIYVHIYIRVILNAVRVF